MVDALVICPFCGSRDFEPLLAPGFVYLPALVFHDCWVLRRPVYRTTHTYLISIGGLPDGLRIRRLNGAKDPPEAEGEARIYAFPGREADGSPQGA